MEQEEAKTLYGVKQSVVKDFINFVNTKRRKMVDRNSVIFIPKLRHKYLLPQNEVTMRLESSEDRLLREAVFKKGDVALFKIPLSEKSLENHQKDLMTVAIVRRKSPIILTIDYKTELEFLSAADATMARALMLEWGAKDGDSEDSSSTSASPSPNSEDSLKNEGDVDVSGN